MKYFTIAQFESLADRFIGEMNAHITQDLMGGTLPQYRAILNMACEANPVSEEQAAKFKNKLVELLQAKAVEIEKRIERAIPDEDFMNSEYACVCLEVDYVPDATLAEALKHAEIKDCHLRQKRLYMIKPDQERIFIQHTNEEKCLIRRAPKPVAASEAEPVRMKM